MGFTQPLSLLFLLVFCKVTFDYYDYFNESFTRSESSCKWEK